MGIVITLGLVLAVGTLVATGVHLSRTRDRVMGYHGVDTPRVNERTHGGGGAS